VVDGTALGPQLGGLVLVAAGGALVVLGARRVPEAVQVT
jgi:hypothetical protein